MHVGRRGRVVEALKGVDLCARIATPIVDSDRAGQTVDAAVSDGEMIDQPVRIDQRVGIRTREPKPVERTVTEVFECVLCAEGSRSAHVLVRTLDDAMRLAKHAFGLGPTRLNARVCVWAW